MPINVGTSVHECHLILSLDIIKKKKKKTSLIRPSPWTVLKDPGIKNIYLLHTNHTLGKLNYPDFPRPS